MLTMRIIANYQEENKKLKKNLQMGDSSKEKLKETGMYHQNICNQRKDAKLVSEI